MKIRHYKALLATQLNRLVLAIVAGTSSRDAKKLELFFMEKEQHQR
jgi:hypothetical protein